MSQIIANRITGIGGNPVQIPSLQVTSVTDASGNQYFAPSSKVVDNYAAGVASFPAPVNGVAFFCRTDRTLWEYVDGTWQNPGVLNYSLTLNVGPGQAFTTLHEAYDYCRSIRIGKGGLITLQLADGVTPTNRVNFNHPEADRILVAGRTVTQPVNNSGGVNAVTATGSDQTHWSLDFTVADASGFSVGDIVSVFTTGVRRHNNRGVWWNRCGGSQNIALPSDTICLEDKSGITVGSTLILCYGEYSYLTVTVKKVDFTGTSSSDAYNLVQLNETIPVTIGDDTGYFLGSNNPKGWTGSRARTQCWLITSTDSFLGLCNYAVGSDRVNFTTIGTAAKFNVGDVLHTCYGTYKVYAVDAANNFVNVAHKFRHSSPGTGVPCTVSTNTAPLEGCGPVESVTGNVVRLRYFTQLNNTKWSGNQTWVNVTDDYAPPAVFGAMSFPTKGYTATLYNRKTRLVINASQGDALNASSSGFIRFKDLAVVGSDPMIRTLANPDITTGASAVICGFDTATIFLEDVSVVGGRYGIYLGRGSNGLLLGRVAVSNTLWHGLVVHYGSQVHGGWSCKLAVNTCSDAGVTIYGSSTFCDFLSLSVAGILDCLSVSVDGRSAGRYTGGQGITVNESSSLVSGTRTQVACVGYHAVEAMNGSAVYAPNAHITSVGSGACVVHHNAKLSARAATICGGVDNSHLVQVTRSSSLHMVLSNLGSISRGGSVAVEETSSADIIGSVISSGGMSPALHAHTGSFLDAQRCVVTDYDSVAYAGKKSNIALHDAAYFRGIGKSTSPEFGDNYMFVVYEGSSVNLSAVSFPASVAANEFTRFAKVTDAGQMYLWGIPLAPYDPRGLFSSAMGTVWGPGSCITSDNLNYINDFDAGRVQGSSLVPSDNY